MNHDHESPCYILTDLWITPASILLHGEACTIINQVPRRERSMTYYRQIYETWWDYTDYPEGVARQRLVRSERISAASARHEPVAGSLEYGRMYFRHTI